MVSFRESESWHPFLVSHGEVRCPFQKKNELKIQNSRRPERNQTKTTSRTTTRTKDHQTLQERIVRVELQLLDGKSKVMIKKHGSDLYLSPKHLEPHKMIQSSDKALSVSSTVKSPYATIGIDSYTPRQPWTLDDIEISNTTTTVADVQCFPSVEEMDNEFDGRPSEGNPFIEVD